MMVTDGGIVENCGEDRLSLYLRYFQTHRPVSDKDS
jgi:hypothetical protein